MRRPGSDQADRDAAAVALESYLVRRIICWADTRGYNDVMLSLLAALATLDPSAPAAHAITKALVEQSAEAYRWADDDRVRKAWTSQRFYAGYNRRRVLRLEALEEHSQCDSDKGEPIVKFDFSGLEIEHILPQAKHWPLPSRESARIDRESRLHGVGNLTLVTGKLNPPLSNAAWLDAPSGAKGQRTALDAHSKLPLNARLVKRWPGIWDEAAIDERAAIFEAAHLIWPAPPAAGAAARAASWQP
jgi:hypothetical protein